MLALMVEKHTLLLRLAFVSWALTYKRTQAVYFETEYERLSVKMRNDVDTIWNMRKVDLVKEAILRLNYSREKAESKTANQLRYELKQLKDQVKEEEVESSGLPRGLEKLQLVVLQAEADARGIALEDSNGKMKVRQALIGDIREYEEAKAEEKKKQDAELAEWQDATGQIGQEMEVDQESASSRRVTMRRNIATPRRE